MKTPIRPLGRSSAAAVALWLVLAPGAHAANLAWTNALGGTAGVAANWNPAQVPVAADNLRFTLNNTYTVTFGSHVPESRQLLVRDGVVTLRFPTEHTVSTLLSVTPIAAGPTPEAVVEAGTLNLSGDLLVGDAAGTTGTLIISGANTSVNVQDAFADFTVGRSGLGTIEVVDGATLTAEGDLELGPLSGGIGTLVVSGGSGSPFQRSSATIHSMTVTDGEVQVLDGAQLEVEGRMFLAHLPNTQAELVVKGASVEDSARVNIRTGLDIGRGANPIPGGAATFTVGNYGVAEVSGATWTYDETPGGTGKLIVREHGRFATTFLHVGDPATELEHHGLIQILGGELDLSGHALTVDDPGASPVLELHDAISYLTSATAPTLTVGGIGEGTIRLRSSFMRVQDENAIIGDDAGSHGTLEVLDVGSTLHVDEALLLGREGQGTLRVRDGSGLTLNQLAIGTQPSGDGTLDLDGAGTEARVADTFDLAGLPGGGSNAPGRVILTNGARLWLDRPVLSGNVWPTGELSVDSGSELHLAGTLSDRGEVLLSDGSVVGGTLQPILGGRLTGSGDVSSQIFALLDTTGVITATGDLSLGDATSPLGVQFAGRLDVSLRTVTLRDADSAVVGTVVMTGGTLVAPPGGIHLPLDRRVTGTGVIQGPIRPVGRMIATGPNGFSFEGLVLGAGQGLSGTMLNFRPGSLFLGGGRMDGTIFTDTGSVLAPTLDVTLGGAPVLSFVTLNGTLLVGPGIEVDLNPTDTTRVKGQVVLANGYLENEAGKTLLIREEGTLRGNGTVVGALRLSGRLDPGVGMRRLLLGPTQFESTAHLLFDVGDYASGALDTVTASGTVTLGGALDLQTQPGFVPAVGDSFLVLSATGVSGSFASVTLNGSPAEGVIALHVHSNGVWAVFVANPLAVPGEPGPHAGLASVRFTSVGSPAPRPSFALELPEAADARIELFDVAGRRVASLHHGPLAAGRYTFAVPRAMAPGLCLARAELRGASGTQVRVARAVRIP